MQEKILTIPFNKKLSLQTYKAIWVFSNRKNVKSNIIYTVLGVACFAMVLTTETKKDFSIGSAITGGYLFYMSLTWLGFFERRIRHFKKVGNQMLRYEIESMVGTYVLSDDTFEYYNNELSLKFRWTLFSPLIIYKDNILLVLKDNNSVSFAISRYEVGDQEFQNLCYILREKISGVN